MSTTPAVVHLPPRLFMGACLAAALVIAAAARSGAAIPVWLLPVEVGATILSLFLLGSFTYQLEKGALTYGMSLVMSATFAGSAWAQQGLQGGFSSAELRGWLDVLQAATATPAALFHVLDELIHLDTMLFILGLAFFVACIAHTRVLEEAAFYLLRRNAGAVLPTVIAITAAVAAASGIFSGVSMIGLAIRTLVIILLLAQAPPHLVRYAVIVCTAVTTVCGMWLAYGEPPNLIMKANLINPATGMPYLTDGFFLLYCLPAAVLTYGCVAWSLRQEIGGLRVDLAKLDVLDANAAAVRFLQAARHGEVLMPVEFAEAHAAELGAHTAGVVERTRTGEALGLALVHAGVAQPLRKLLLGRFIDTSLADALDRHYVLESQHLSPGLDEGEVVIARALAALDKRRIAARRTGLLAALPFGVLLVLHALNHNLPVFLAAFAGFAVALAAIWNLPEMRAAALRAGWLEFSEYLFLLPLFFSISLLTRSGFFGQFQQLIEIGSRTMGPASMALAQFFGSSVLSALLDNNVVADFAARAIQGLPTALILLFSMSQIAGYALGGCWTHIGSAQSVVAYAFIRRDLDPRFGPLQYVRAVSPLLAMMAVVLTLYICVVAYVTSGG